MRNILLLLGITLCLSFSLSKIENKFIGKWRITENINNDGKSTKGKATITFSEDRTLLSVKDTGGEKKGYWFVRNDSLFVGNDSLFVTGKRREFGAIIKINKKKCIIKGKNFTVHMKKLTTTHK